MLLWNYVWSFSLSPFVEFAKELNNRNKIKWAGPFSGVGEGLMGIGSLGGSRVDFYST